MVRRGPEEPQQKDPKMCFKKNKFCFHYFLYNYFFEEKWLFFLSVSKNLLLPGFMAPEDR